MHAGPVGAEGQLVDAHLIPTVLDTDLCHDRWYESLKFNAIYVDRDWNFPIVQTIDTINLKRSIDERRYEAGPACAHPS